MDISILNLTKYYGEFCAVDSVSFSFSSGKLTAIVGRNGSGKTTTIRSVLGLVPKDGGEITVNGIESNFAKDDLFPSPDLYPSPELYPREATANLLIYKFKMYREVYENPELPPVLQDTGFYYVQYKELTKFGLINNLKIKYERG